MTTKKRFKRFSALFLTLALCLSSPNSAFALRPMGPEGAGLEELKNRFGISEGKAPVGLEEDKWKVVPLQQVISLTFSKDYPIGLRLESDVQSEPINLVIFRKNLTEGVAYRIQRIGSRNSYQIPVGRWIRIGTAQGVRGYLENTLDYGIGGLLPLHLSFRILKNSDVEFKAVGLVEMNVGSESLKQAAVGFAESPEEPKQLPGIEMRAKMTEMQGLSVPAELPPPVFPELPSADPLVNPIAVPPGGGVRIPIGQVPSAGIAFEIPKFFRIEVQFETPAERVDLSRLRWRVVSRQIFPGLPLEEQEVLQVGANVVSIGRLPKSEGKHLQLARPFISKNQNLVEVLEEDNQGFLIVRDGDGQGRKSSLGTLIESIPGLESLPAASGLEEAVHPVLRPLLGAIRARFDRIIGDETRTSPKGQIYSETRVDSNTVVLSIGQGVQGQAAADLAMVVLEALENGSQVRISISRRVDPDQSGFISRLYEQFLVDEVLNKMDGVWSSPPEKPGSYLERENDHRAYTWIPPAGFGKVGQAGLEQVRFYDGLWNREQNRLIQAGMEEELVRKELVRPGKEVGVAAIPAQVPEGFRIFCHPDTYALFAPLQEQRIGVILLDGDPAGSRQIFEREKLRPETDLIVLPDSIPSGEEEKWRPAENLSNQAPILVVSTDPSSRNYLPPELVALDRIAAIASVILSIPHRIWRAGLEEYREADIQGQRVLSLQL